jgi:hypothetical protein
LIINKKTNQSLSQKSNGGKAAAQIQRSKDIENAKAQSSVRPKKQVKISQRVNQELEPWSSDQYVDSFMANDHIIDLLNKLTSNIGVLQSTLSKLRSLFGN